MSFAASTAILRVSQETQETMHLFSHIRKPDEKIMESTRLRRR